MFKRGRSKSFRRERDGLVSHILLHEGYVPEALLTVTWVDVTPGSGQRPPGPVPEQVYVVVRGRGGMRLGDEKRTVAEGDKVFIPPGVLHSVKNASEEVLAYVSAATPTVDWRAFYDEGPLGPRSREKEGA